MAKVAKPGARIELFHWDPATAEERKRRLTQLGYAVTSHSMVDRPLLRALRDAPPAAFVIDFSRRPSHGRDLALAIRQPKPLRGVPIVFVKTGADEQKVIKIRNVFADAVFTTWTRIGPAIKSALTHRPDPQAPPPGVFAGYSGTPLVKKLGIKPGCVVRLVRAPDNFRTTLGTLPDGVKLERSCAPGALTLWFVRNARELRGEIVQIVRAVGDGRLWMIWQKKASGAATDVSESLVRETALANGLVDYKICAVDQIWSGLLFKRREVPSR
jgi:hypothetical protein